MIGLLEKTVLDCPDPRALAAFYAEVLGMKMLEDEPDWVVIGRREHMRELAFQRVDPYVAPRWPDGQHPQQLHLDIAVENFEVAMEGCLPLVLFGDPGLQRPATASSKILRDIRFAWSTVAGCRTRGLPNECRELKWIRPNRRGRRASPRSSVADRLAGMLLWPVQAGRKDTRGVIVPPRSRVTVVTKRNSYKTRAKSRDVRSG